MYGYLGLFCEYSGLFGRKRGRISKIKKTD